MSKLLIALGLILIGFGAKAWVDYQGFKSSDLRVEAKIVKIEPAQMWMRLPQSARVHVSYHVNGKEYQAGNTALSKRWLAFKVGDDVRLTLIPSQPHKFILSDSLHDSAPLSSVLIAIGFILLALSIFKHHK